MSKIFRFVKKYYKTMSKLLIIYIILNLLIGLIDTSIPYLLGKFIDELVTATNFSFAISYMVIFIILSITAIVVGYIAD